MHDDSKHLLDALRSGNAAAFEQVYLSEKNRVFGLLLRLSGDAHVAADLFQNVWLKLARHAARLHDSTNLRAWLHTVARREYLSYRRAQVIDLSRFLAWGRHVEITARSFAATNEADELEAALEALSERDREVLLLVGVAELESAEAAQALGITEVAYRQRLARARQRLISQLERVHTHAHSRTVPRKARS
ncbi:MAG TPA: RNA polymerase sigma factor [Polyangiaceae bacterium]|nr:RNA polymerase sigma factor [Polyangiaceae bacterium]